jgi:hypothetical protein
MKLQTIFFRQNHYPNYKVLHTSILIQLCVKIKQAGKCRATYNLTYSLGLLLTISQTVRPTQTPVDIHVHAPRVSHCTPTYVPNILHSDKYSASYARDVRNTCVSLHMKRQLLLPDRKQNYNVFTRFCKINVTFHENRFSGCHCAWSCTVGERGGFSSHLRRFPNRWIERSSFCVLFSPLSCRLRN